MDVGDLKLSTGGYVLYDKENEDAWVEINSRVHCEDYI